MFGLGQQYSVFFSFPQSILISLPKKKRAGLGFYVTYIHIREEELYNLGGRDHGRVFYCEWKTSAPLTCPGMHSVFNGDFPCPGMHSVFNAAAETPSLGRWSATASTSLCSPSTFVLMARAGMCRCVPDWRLFLSF